MVKFGSGNAPSFAPKMRVFFRNSLKGWKTGPSNICDVEATDFFDDSCLLYPTKINMFAKERDHSFQRKFDHPSINFQGTSSLFKGCIVSWFEVTCPDNKYSLCLIYLDWLRLVPASPSAAVFVVSSAVWIETSQQLSVEALWDDPFLAVKISFLVVVMVGGAVPGPLRLNVAPLTLNLTYDQIQPYFKVNICFFCFLGLSRKPQPFEKLFCFFCEIDFFPSKNQWVLRGQGYLATGYM